MPAKLECPICLCSIKNKKTDFVATNCGHCFHASCLMRHVDMNGFSCPYCRNNMVGAPVESPPVVVRRKVIRGRIYLMDNNYNLYGYNAYVNEGNDNIVGMWDPTQDRVVERLIEV